MIKLDIRHSHLNNLLQLSRVLRQPLYRNSIFLMLGSAAFGISGFFFWILAARLYSHEQVGVASAVMSFAALLGIISLPGFDISIARFIADEREKSKMVNSCISVSLLLALVVAVVSLFVLKLIGSTLSASIESIPFLLLFIGLTIMDPVVVLQRQGVFIGLRKGQYSFLQAVTFLFRLVTVPFFVGLGVFGIVLSAGISLFLALILGFILMLKVQIRPAFEIRKETITGLLRFSLGNYMAKVLIFLPGQLLPIIVLNMMGATSNAYFYIAWATSNLLLAIPTATSFSLLAEGSNKPDDLGHYLKRSIQFSLLILIIATGILMLTAKFILSLFGPGYVDASFYPLLLLAAGNIPATINFLYVAALRVKKQVKSVIMIQGGIALTTLLGSYLLMPFLGLEGIGLTWIAANLVMAVVSGIVMLRKGI